MERVRSVILGVDGEQHDIKKGLASGSFIKCAYAARKVLLKHRKQNERQTRTVMCSICRAFAEESSGKDENNNYNN
jgi:hypothetical protein